MRALETPHSGDDVQWLTYWVSWLLVKGVEALTDHPIAHRSSTDLSKYSSEHLAKSGNCRTEH